MHDWQQQFPMSVVIEWSILDKIMGVIPQAQIDGFPWPHLPASIMQSSSGNRGPCLLYPSHSK
jgi:hypothetical protein